MFLYELATNGHKLLSDCSPLEKEEMIRLNSRTIPVSYVVGLENGFVTYVHL